MKNFAFNSLAGRLGDVIGHRNLVRIGAFLVRAGRQDMPNHIAANGEALIQKTMLSKVNKTEVIIIDCGANIGQWSTQLFETTKAIGHASDLKVFCFEPSSFTHDKLSAKLEKLQSPNMSFSAIKKALSNRPGMLNLKIVHDGAGTNSLVNVPGGYASEETVLVTTVDEFVAENGLEKIHLLKVDAEGHDLDVIRGAENLLDEQRINLIQFEYNWRWIYGKHFLQEAFEYLTQRDYEIGKITPAGIQFYAKYDTQLESFIEGNYLACSKSWKGFFRQVTSWLG